jgi:hypothetical protein
VEYLVFMDSLVKYCPGIHIVMCIAIARQRHGKHIPATNMHATIRGYPLLGNGAVNTVFSMGSDPRLYNKSLFLAREIVGGDKKGSLESETVKYGHESYRTRTRK